MRISASEFYRNPGAFLERVRLGESIELTRRGKVIAMLEPPQAPESHLLVPPIISSRRSTGPHSYDRFLFGAFTYGGVWQGTQAIERLEQALQYKLDIVHWFMSWDNAFDKRLVQSVTQRNQLPLISWEPHHLALEDIISGSWDGYLKQWALGAKDLNTSIYLRPFPEMNGDWTSWHGEPELLRVAWRHIVKLFRHYGANNVYWVWSPNISDEPRTEQNRMEAYYPGQAFVDILALDGYNHGTSKPHTAWKSFEDIFREPYERITTLGNQPFWIAETGCAEEGGNKAQWIREMLRSCAFPRLQAIVWFNQQKEADWRIDSSSQAQAAFHQGLSDLVLAGTLQPSA